MNKKQWQTKRRCIVPEAWWWIPFPQNEVWTPWCGIKAVLHGAISLWRLTSLQRPLEASKSRHKLSICISLQWPPLAMLSSSGWPFLYGQCPSHLPARGTPASLRIQLHTASRPSPVFKPCQWLCQSPSLFCLSLGACLFTFMSCLTAGTMSW